MQGKAKVTSFDKKPGFATLRALFPPGSVAGIAVGASVAVNGTCLTVTQQHGNELCFDLIVETLRATNLGTLGVDSSVNFERSARFGDEVGGHTVSGHVHTTAAISDIEITPSNRKVVFKVPPALMKYILPKASTVAPGHARAIALELTIAPAQGFIAVDGCSLTVGEVTPDTFCVWLIPETLRATTFGDRAVGDVVNIELDSQTVAIVDTVERVLAAR